MAYAMSPEDELIKQQDQLEKEELRAALAQRNEELAALQMELLKQKEDGKSREEYLSEAMSTRGGSYRQNLKLKSEYAFKERKLAMTAMLLVTEAISEKE